MKLGNSYPEPPTIYALLNSYVNFSNETPVKISDLASAGRAAFFDFDYPLTSNITKTDFETMILSHFMMRRIGYETVTAFKIALNVKLNEIMPMYNKLFDAINGWSLFNDGETITRSTNDIGSSSTSTGSNSTTGNTSDRRFSNTPQNAIADVQSGTYVSEYNYDHDTGTASTTGTSSTSNTNSTAETIIRTPSDKISVYSEFLKNKQDVYTMIFKDLDPLFYQII